VSASHAVHPSTTPARPAGRTTGGRRSTGLGRIGQTAVLAGILLGTLVFIAAPAADAAQGPVGLATAGSFAVLAGSGITNTGPTTITGDVGTFPTPSETGFGSITLVGTNHDGDAVTQGAKSDLVTAYNDAAGRTPVTQLPVELGGSTLTAGVYASPTFGLTGTLTLDAQGNPNAEFVFQAGSTLITAASSRVQLVNGADACHVVWQVGSSATFAPATRFVGDVLAYTSITAQTGAVFQGRLLARNGAVTLDTNTITASTCAAPTTTATATSTTATGTSTPGATATTVSGSPTTTAVTGSTTPTRISAASTATGSTTGTVGGSTTPYTGLTGTAGKLPAIPGTIPAVPRVTVPGTSTASPSLPFTGARTSLLLGGAFALLALGTGALLAGRRTGKAHLPRR